MADWKENLKFRCTGCGNCCREPIIVVSDADVLRLQARTGQSADKVVGFYGPDELSFRKSWPGWVRLRHGRNKVSRFMMGLRRTWNQCQYLRQDQCTVYENRPVACRKWPLDPSFNGNGKIVNLQIIKEIECPYELDGHNSKKEIKHVFAWDDRQDETYFEKVRDWHRQEPVGRARDFLRYLGLPLH